ncbi:MAG: DUF4843 domain-containing protein [Bacteroidaceae bacterium]|nr:DUF4843 domain-containing protein [Bacteroidaceae bacterium]
MKKNIFITLAGALLFTACTADDIDTFDSNNYLSFESTSLSYTFTFSDASITSHDFEVPVAYAGRYRNTEARFLIAAKHEGSTAQEGVHYQLLDESNNIIPAGTNKGTAKIRLLRTADMKEQTFKLKLYIKPNENFKAGVTDSMEVSITDRLVKPNWWGNTPYDRFLGSYTETKLRLWFEFMGVSDGSDPFDTDEYIQWLDYGTGVFDHKSYRDSATKPKIMEFHDWLIRVKGNPVDETTGRPVSEGLGSF